MERKGEELRRPAGGACSLPEPRQSPSSLLFLRLSRTPARSAPGPAPQRGASLLLGCWSAIARPQGCVGCGAVSRGWWFGGRSLLSLTEGLAGKEGERGDTHTRRGARALHTSSRAPPARRVRRCWPRGLGPRTCRLSALRSGPAPSQRTLPCLARPALPSRWGIKHPDNLQTVAQLVSTTEALECCPSEVSFLRVPGPSSPDPPSRLGLRDSGSERILAVSLHAPTVSALCWG